MQIGIRRSDTVVRRIDVPVCVQCRCARDLTDIPVGELDVDNAVRIGLECDVRGTERSKLPSGASVDVNRIEPRQHVQNDGLAGTDALNSCGGRITVDNVTVCIANAIIGDVFPTQVIAAGGCKRGAQLVQGGQRAVREAFAFCVGTLITENGAEVSLLNGMAVKEGRTRDPGPGVRVFHPFAQKLCNLLGCAVGLVLIDVGRVCILVLTGAATARRGARDVQRCHRLAIGADLTIQRIVDGERDLNRRPAPWLLNEVETMIEELTKQDEPPGIRWIGGVGVRVLDKVLCIGACGPVDVCHVVSGGVGRDAKSLERKVRLIVRRSDRLRDHPGRVVDDVDKGIGIVGMTVQSVDGSIRRAVGSLKCVSQHRSSFRRGCRNPGVYR